MNEMLISGDVVIYLVGLAATWGAAMWRISSLERKMDKHNCLVERMAVAERDIANTNRRVNELNAKAGLRPQ